MNKAVSLLPSITAECVLPAETEVILYLKKQWQQHHHQQKKTSINFNQLQKGAIWRSTKPVKRANDFLNLQVNDLAYFLLKALLIGPGVL